MLIFAKLPRPGHVKTRLIPALGRDGAAELYRAFLDDTVRLAHRIEGVSSSLWVIPQPGAVRKLRERYGAITVQQQSGGDLGERMRDAFDRAFASGADHAVLTGSDLPTLPSSYLIRAFEALKGAHLVLGPTEDGGYYAIGLRRYAWPGAAELFAGVSWSTSDVLAQTRQRAEALDLCHVELPTWYDVDEPQQLARLAEDLDPLSETGRTLRTFGWGRRS